MELCDIAAEQLEAELVAHAASESRGLARFLDLLAEYDRPQAASTPGPPQAATTAPTLPFVRGNRPPSIDALSEWQTRAYPTLRRERDSGTPAHDALPDDDELDVDKMIAAIRALKGLRADPGHDPFR